MLFSAKLKGFFVEQSAHSTLLARTSSPVPPMMVEEVRECLSGDDRALAEAIKQLQPRKGPSGYMQATCGVFIPKRVVRKVTLDLKKVKEPEYFTDIINQQLRVEPANYTTVIINATDGHDFDATRPNLQKEVLFGAMPMDDILQLQDKLLLNGIYPERLELGTFSVLGSLVDFLTLTNNKTPTLVLEVGPDVTHSFIVSSSGVEASRPIPQGYESMVPVVQKELGLKDEESARKLFFSNTFDFTGMGPALIKKLMKELQSSIGFYEVQTGQSIGLLHSLLLPPKLAWLNGVMATSLGVGTLNVDLPTWLESRNITLSESVQNTVDARWLGLLSLMVNYHQETSSSHAVAEKKD